MCRKVYLEFTGHNNRINKFGTITKFLKYTLCNILLFIPCIFLKLTHQPAYALYKIQLKTSIKLLHVSASGCYHQGVIQNKGVQAQHAKLGTVSPLLE